MRCFAWMLGGFVLLGSFLLLSPQPRDAAAQTNGSVLNWIWSADGSALKAPAETRYFRKVLSLDRFADEAVIDITADDGFTLWVNGEEVGSGTTWNRVYRFNVTPLFKMGKVVLSVEAKNTSPGAAGLLVKIGYTPNGQNNKLVTSDASWKVSKTLTEGWQKPNFDDSKWEAAHEVGKYGTGPWKGQVWDAGGDDRFSVPPGFKVEMVVPPSTLIPGFHSTSGKAKRGEPNFSLVNMCFDAKGRLLCSQERGPIVMFTEPDSKGVFKKTSVFCDAIRNAHGMNWIDDYLYVVGDGKDEKGAGATGLWRGKVTQGKDQVEKLELLHRFRGGMGEHGPHAVIHGPDNKLYIVIGNHAGAQVEKLASNSPLVRWPTGAMGPDQDKPNTTEDVLLPRQNDARGHAANILAPGGTIWRMDLDGKNPALFSAGYRNQFDAAFNPAGELFTFDSDMEWDENLPWYRAVRVCHAIPGSDFVWRTGAANTPNYYADSLPPTVETGRGSPTGVEFYDHHLFGPKFKGCFFMCDWSIGTIWAVHLTRDGATYTGKAERFCSASPMPVSDCAVGPDGALYFTLGGRNTQGGVYRIVPENVPVAERKSNETDQPLAPWGAQRNKLGVNPAAQVREMEKSLREQDAESYAHYLTLIGEAGLKDHEKVLLKALSHSDALVRRRACEALIRLEIEPPVALIHPLLADKNIFLRTAARLVLQKIDPKKWAKELISDSNDRIAHEAIIALCKIGQADGFGGAIFDRLHENPRSSEVEALLEWLRTIQLALIHCKERPGAVRGIALDCKAIFPHADWRVNRELAILLADFARHKDLSEGVPTELIQGILNAKDDRAQAIHYFYCLRVVKDQFEPDLKQKLLEWYDGTKTWTGGASFTPFLENILKDYNDVFTPADRATFFAKAEKFPQTAMVLFRMTKPESLPPPENLGELYLKLSAKTNLPRLNEFKEGILDGLARSKKPEAAKVLRDLAEKDASQRVAIARALTKFPTAENLPVFVKTLATATGPTAYDLLDAILKTPAKPKPEDGASFRVVLLSASKLPEAQRWKAVEVLQHWTNGKSFGGSKGDWKRELPSWGRWFSQAYPKEAALPDLVAGPKVESKYKYEDLLALVEKEKGDAQKGRVVYEKAQCIKCHQHGEIGVGVGPDLSTLGKRFKRAEILESIYYPSKVISDQFRSTTVVLLDGKRYDGILAENGDNFSIVLQDTTKVNFTRDDIERRFDSLISVMPEKTIDELTKEEIVDLFAFLETVVPEKKK